LFCPISIKAEFKICVCREWKKKITTLRLGTLDKIRFYSSFHTKIWHIMAILYEHQHICIIINYDCWFISACGVHLQNALPAA
jgi:hypothetical protein